MREHYYGLYEMFDELTMKNDEIRMMNDGKRERASECEETCDDIDERHDYELSNSDTVNIDDNNNELQTKELSIELSNSETVNIDDNNNELRTKELSTELSNSEIVNIDDNNNELRTKELSNSEIVKIDGNNNERKELYNESEFHIKNKLGKYTKHESDLVINKLGKHTELGVKDFHEKLKQYERYRNELGNELNDECDNCDVNKHVQMQKVVLGNNGELGHNDRFQNGQEDSKQFLLHGHNKRQTRPRSRTSFSQNSRKVETVNNFENEVETNFERIATMARINGLRSDENGRPSEHLANDDEHLVNENSRTYEKDASSKISFEPSLDDASSIANGGSRRSLADTSVTSTADISHVSAGQDSHSLGTGAGGSDVEVFVHSTGPSTPRAGTPRATTPRSPRHSSPRHSSRSPDDRIRIYVPYESPSHSPKPAAPKHQNSHDSDATIMNSANGSTLNGHPASLPNSYSASYIPPRSPTRLKHLESHRSVSNPTSLYEQYETNKITIHIVDDNLATPLGDRIPTSVSSPFHMEQPIDLK
ncbi:hypothetical protein WDU94_001231 [Cyamophila willieti]